MPPKKGPLWQFFHQGGTLHTSHYKAYCLGCIEAHHQTHSNDSDAIDVDTDATSSLRYPSEQQWFKHMSNGWLTHGRRKWRWRWTMSQDPLTSLGPSCARCAELFGGGIANPPRRAPRKAFTREELLMELLAAEHSEEEPDDGELEGSGDDFIVLMINRTLNKRLRENTVLRWYEKAFNVGEVKPD
ncbi:hypothetical protein B0H14DRAFT_3546293 [Mycena olivaceomarginata]|nr:hypothetical protein B0H14DRAFT_3546293 [Mycena olivaceomarginata]